MKINDVARTLNARLLTRGPSGSARVDRIYAGDRVSDLLNHVSETTLLITNLANVSLLRVTELMDIPGICLVNNARPDDAMLEQAEDGGTLLMVSPDGLFETCGRLYQAFIQNGTSE